MKRAFALPYKGALVARALREQLMSLGLAAPAAAVPADMVVVSSPSMFLGLAGLTLSWAKRAKFVWDVRNITWRYAKEVVGVSRGVALGARVLQAYTLPVVRRAHLLVGATPGVSQVLMNSGRDANLSVRVQRAAGRLKVQQVVVRVYVPLRTSVALRYSICRFCA